MIGVKKIISKILFPHTYSSEAYVQYLKKKGVRIGEGSRFVNPKKVTIDIQNPMFLEIGSDVCFTSNVTILAHDWSYSVVAKKYGVAPAKQRVTHIGNNVFIGMGTVVMMGAYIGNNVIVGAGSVVTGRLEDNSVYAGNPTKRICSLDEHRQKLENDFENSALIYINRYAEINGCLPKFESLGIYASLFVEKTEENMNKYFSKSVIPETIKNMNKKYDSIEEFLHIGKL